eukprot:IDg21535t1
MIIRLSDLGRRGRVGRWVCGLVAPVVGYSWSCSLLSKRFISCMVHPQQQEDCIVARRGCGRALFGARACGPVFLPDLRLSGIIPTE